MFDSISGISYAPLSLSFGAVDQQNKDTIDHNVITQEKGYVWPDYGTLITDSEKTNVTVQFGSNGYASKAKTTFEYWIREKKNSETKNKFHEFHYRCYFENMDPT